DANCVHCASFEEENSEAIDELAADGHTVEYRLVNFLDNPGTDNYSSRAANAATCVAEESPENSLDFIGELFASYNTHQGAGLSNEEIESVASDRSEEHTSELHSRFDLVCRLLLEQKKKNTKRL